jgi:hypothetical protein
MRDIMSPFCFVLLLIVPLPLCLVFCNEERKEVSKLHEIRTLESSESECQTYRLLSPITEENQPSVTSKVIPGIHSLPMPEK